MSSNSQLSPIALFGGIGIWLLSLIWCLAFYAPWGQGIFRLLRLKIPCVIWTSAECIDAQQLLNVNYTLPTYQPWLWWAGTILLVVGLTLRRRPLER